jgi:hypothetical protein
METPDLRESGRSNPVSQPQPRNAELPSDLATPLKARRLYCTGLFTFLSAFASQDDGADRVSQAKGIRRVRSFQKIIATKGAKSTKTPK